MAEPCPRTCNIHVKLQENIFIKPKVYFPSSQCLQRVIKNQTFRLGPCPTPPQNYKKDVYEQIRKYIGASIKNSLSKADPLDRLPYQQ